MKIKTIIIFSIISIIVALGMYFYYSGRIIIITHKNFSEETQTSFANIFNHQAVWINPNNENRNVINIHVSEKSDNIMQSQEKLLNLYLQSYFHHINIEYNDKYTYHFKHALLTNNIVIIQGTMNQIKELTILDEYFFLKSVFLSIQAFIPSIKKIIFYSEDKLLPLEHCIPYFNQQMLIEYHKIKSIPTASIHKNALYIGYTNTILGNSIDKQYEKSIYQKPLYKKQFLSITKEDLKNNTNLINHFCHTNNKQIIYYNQLEQDETEKTYIFYYPFLTWDNNEIEHTCSLLPDIHITNDDITKLQQLESTFPHSKAYLAPLKLFFNTIYQQFFLLHKITSYDQAILKLNQNFLL
jgi:hypothetical protein